MNKVFVLLLSFTSLIPFTGTYAQKDPHEQHIDSLWQAEQYEEALKLNDEMLALKKPKTDYFAIRNKVVCYTGLGDYKKAAENRALLYKAYNKKKLSYTARIVTRQYDKLIITFF